MASDIVSTPPDDWFTPPGTVRISAAALELARAFREQAMQARPREDWVISFDWSDARRVREAGTNAWRDLGAGIDLTAYEAERVKAALTETLGGVRVAVKIPSAVWKAAGERLIDVNEAAFSGVVLR